MCIDKLSVWVYTQEKRMSDTMVAHMLVRTSLGPVDVGEVYLEVTIGSIVERVQKRLCNRYPNSKMARGLQKGKKLLFVAYNTILPEELKLSQLMEEGFLSSSSQDNFFYKCWVVLEK